MFYFLPGLDAKGQEAKDPFSTFLSKICYVNRGSSYNFIRIGKVIPKENYTKYFLHALAKHIRIVKNTAGLEDIVFPL
jgi:hypothetical protein